jgi:hypothetical protein
MLSDFDKKIGFWIKGIPYIWIEGKNIFDSQRLYLLNSSGSKLVVFDEDNNPTFLSSVIRSKSKKDEGEINKYKKFGRNSEGPYTLFPFSDKCVLPKQCFQVWTKDKNFKSQEIRLEGEIIDLPEDLPDIDYKVVIFSDKSDLSKSKSKSDLSKSKSKSELLSHSSTNSDNDYEPRNKKIRTIKVYTRITKSLDFYRSVLYKKDLYAKVAGCIFSIDGKIKPFETFDDINFQIPYYSDKNMLKYTIHRGQCKLFLNEMQFLTKYLKNNTDEGVVIYPGGCPAHHLWYMLQFFPKLKFISIDPQACELYVERTRNVHFKQTEWDSYVYLKTNKENDYKNARENQRLKLIGDEDPSQYVKHINETDYRVYFIQDILTISLAKHLKKLKNAFYISDIRFSIMADNRPYDIDIVWNSSQQYNWLSILKPRAYMLKFRLPFHQPLERINMDKIPEQYIDAVKEDFAYSKKLGIDFLEDYENDNFNYLKGDVFIQPWPGTGSTETRLVGETMELKNYGSYLDYEKKFAYYNLIRSIGLFENPLANKKLGFDHCGDCSLEYKIWKDYADKYNKKMNMSWIYGLMKITGQHFLQHNHGIRFETLTMKKYKEDYKTLFLYDKNKPKFNNNKNEQNDRNKKKFNNKNDRNKKKFNNKR